MNICYIICALDCKTDFSPDETDLVIGADRGCLVAYENNCRIDVAMGDFDSYTGDLHCENVIKFPVVKDDTDSALAIEYAIEKGYKKIAVYGAVGGAGDHTLANLSLIARYVEKGIELYFTDGENVWFGLHCGSAGFSKDAKGRISVFSYTDKSYGVYEKGLLYRLDNVTLKNTVALGVSNEFTGAESEITVHNGTLLIYTSKINYEKYLTKKKIGDIL